MPSARSVAIWGAVALVAAVPVGVAATSPLLQWRGPVYIAAGFAGVVAMALLFLQPLLAAGQLPGLGGRNGRQVHRWTGLALLAAILVHVGGLWITSPPDVIDALTFTSPTPFSAWGVIAMWALFGAALLAVLRRRFRGRLPVWRLAHTGLALVVVSGSVLHAVLIEGTMGDVTKLILCIVALAAFAASVRHLGSWALLSRLARRG